MEKFLFYLEGIKTWKPVAVPPQRPPTSPPTQLKVKKQKKPWPAPLRDTALHL